MLCLQLSPLLQDNFEFFVPIYICHCLVLLIFLPFLLIYLLRGERLIKMSNCLDKI